MKKTKRLPNKLNWGQERRLTLVQGRDLCAAASRSTSPHSAEFSETDLPRDVPSAEPGPRVSRCSLDGIWSGDNSRAEWRSGRRNVSPRPSPNHPSAPGMDCLPESEEVNPLKWGTSFFKSHWGLQML
uniref:Uncharacterized protein n=1 Tax=Molossus molossus TaxID=27622 RepID=A0A7J8DTP6_MOLMO|nr:hypothetical protein HJG59_009113 [Molossus molossus]